MDEGVTESCFSTSIRLYIQAYYDKKREKMVGYQERINICILTVEDNMTSFACPCRHFSEK